MGGANAVLQADAIWKIVLDVEKIVSVSDMGGLSTGTLVAVPSVFSLEPHNSVCPCMSPVHPICIPPAVAQGEWLGMRFCVLAL